MTRSILRFLFFSLAALCVPAAHAAVAASCQPGDTEFLCHLRSVLTLLHAVAVVMGLFLAIVIALAVRAYRRKNQKLTPEDLSPDAK